MKKISGGVNVSPSTELNNEGTDIGVVAKDAKECEDNKSYIIEWWLDIVYLKGAGDEYTISHFPLYWGYNFL